MSSQSTDNRQSARKLSLFPPEWWEHDDPDERARAMYGVAESLEIWSYQRRFANLAYARMFSGRDLPTVYGFSMSTKASGSPSIASQYLNFMSPAFNLIGSCIESLVNKLGRNRLWVEFLTDGGTYAQREAGKGMTDYVEGLFYATKFNREKKQCLQDALVWGTSFVKRYEEWGKLAIKRVLCDSILVDDFEAIRGKPKNLFERDFVHKQSLAAYYLERGAPGDQGTKRRAEIERAIYSAPSAAPGLMGAGSIQSVDMIPVVEGWHLGDGPNPEGVHFVAIGNISLTPKEEHVYKKSDFPFSKLVYQDLGVGYWGQGLAEILSPHQKNINRLSNVIQEAQARVGVPRVIVDTQSGITPAMLQATVGGFIPKTPGSPSPDFITPPSIGADIYDEREKEIEKGFRRAGVAEDMAAGNASDKVRSGAAEDIREDIKSQRFICTGQALEDFAEDVAIGLLDLASDLKPEVEVPGRANLKWADVKINLTEYKVQAFPISSFSTSPAARLREADRMLASGRISKENYDRVVDYPDVQAISDLNTAGTRNVDRTLSQMLSDGIYRAPDKYMNLALALETAHARYEYERAAGMSDEELELVRIFIDQCVALQGPPPQAVPTAPALPAQATVANGPQGLETQATLAAAPTGLASAGASAAQPSAGAPPS